jgi:hypothetical protein
MRKASVWFLAIAGLAGLVTALWPAAHGGGVSRLRPEGPTLVEPMVYRMGHPDAWLEWSGRPNGVPDEWESRPNGEKAGVYFLRWSFGILVASVCALCYAMLLSRRTPLQKPAEPGAASDGGR